MEETNSGESIFYIVVRTYHHIRRVEFISLDEQAARDQYKSIARVMRDGRVAVWKCVRQTTLELTDGGYNRTKW